MNYKKNKKNDSDFFRNLKPEIAGNLNKNYELLGKNYEAGFMELSGRNPELISENTGAKVISNKKLTLEFFKNTILIDIEEKKMYEDGGAGPMDSFSSALILHFLLNADGTPLFGEWVTYRDLPDGLFYASTIPGVLQPVLLKYESDGNGFINRIVELGGKTYDSSKFAGILYPFKRFPVLFILEEKDEEFDASIRALFDRSSSHYLKTDIIKTLLVYTVKRLVS